MTAPPDRVVVLLSVDGSVWLQDTDIGPSAANVGVHESPADPLDLAAERLVNRTFNIDVEGAADPVAYVAMPESSGHVGVFLVNADGRDPQPTAQGWRRHSGSELEDLLSDPEAIADPYTLIALQRHALHIAWARGAGDAAGSPHTRATPTSSGSRVGRSAVLLERADRYGYTATFDITWFQDDGQQGSGPTHMLLHEALAWANEIAEKVIVRTGSLDRYSAGDMPALDPETGAEMPSLPEGFEVHPRPAP